MAFNLSNYMVKGMNKVFLSCDKATFLLVRNEYERLLGLSKMRVRIHLAMCPYCRRFKKQNELITKMVCGLKGERPNSLLQLSSKSKKRIISLLDKERSKE